MYNLYFAHKTYKYSNFYFLEQLLVLLCFLMNIMGAVYTRIRLGPTEKVNVADSSIIVKPV